MDKKQIFTLLVIWGLVALGIVAFYLLKEVRSIMREKAKQEIVAEGFRGAKDIFNRFNQSPSQ